MTLQKKFTLWFLAAAVLIGLTVAFCPPISHAQNSGPINSPRFNTDYYVGVSPYPLTIQSAVNAACANVLFIHKGTVIVSPGLVPTDVPTAVTGCIGVGIVVKTVFPWACYASSGGLYTSTSCTGGGGGGGCPFLTCIQNNPVGSQTIAQPANSGFGISVLNWPTTGGNFAGIVDSCTFDTYLGDTGGGSNSGLTVCRDAYSTFTAPGWMYSINYGTANQIARRIVTNISSMGVGGGLDIETEKTSNQEVNGLSITTKTGHNAIDPSGEGVTGIQNKILTVGSSSSAVNTGGGGSGATSVVTTGIPSDNGVPKTGPSRIAIDTQTPISATQTIIAGNLFQNAGVVQVGLPGVTITTPSVCGALAQGSLPISITSYQISSNLVVFQATNNFVNGEPITITGFATSTFLNGSYTAAFVSPTSFAVGLTHANTGVVTEAGKAFTINVDTPRAALNAYTSMTFGISLGSAYGGSTTALTSAFGKSSGVQFAKLVAVGAYDSVAGIQYITMPLIRPLKWGPSSDLNTEICIGGSLQEYYATNTTANLSTGNGFYNVIVGNPTTSSAYETAVLAGNLMQTGIYAGTVTLYPGAEILNISGSTLTLSQNQAPWANGDSITFPQGLTSLVAFQNNAYIGDNPFAIVQGNFVGYFGPPLVQGGTLNTIQGQEDPSGLVSNGGYGYALWDVVVQGHTAGRAHQAPPSDAFLTGTTRPAALDYVSCEYAPCVPIYYRFFDNEGTGPFGFEQYTPATGTFNFGAQAGSAVLQENASRVFTVSNKLAGLFNLLGDTLYAGAAGAPTKLAGNTTATANILCQTGTGTVSAAPSWCTYLATATPLMDGTPTVGTSPLLARQDHIHPVDTSRAAATASTQVNGQTCQLSGTCTVTAAPSGAAGGALAGTYPNPTIANPSTTPNGVTCTLASTCAVLPILCADTSGSGTAQSCTTTPTFTLSATPATSQCFVYTSTTANSGTGLTLSVNGSSAKSVGKVPGNTTTLVIGDLAANLPVEACYNGTNIYMMTVANAAAGSISGATTGQALIAGSPTTATSSIPLNGAGGGLVTGPTSVTATANVACYTGTAGQLQDGGGVTCKANGMTLTGQQSAKTYVTATNCISSASPAVCASAAGGAVVIAALSSTVTVNDTSVTNGSTIGITFDSSLSSRLGVTCNTSYVEGHITAKTAATSFTITTSGTVTTNPACFTFTIIN